MFRDKPKNMQTISDIIDANSDANGIYDEQTIDLLESTRKFLAATATDFQEARDASITDKRMQEIFSSLTSAITKFNKNKQTPEHDETLAYCVSVIREQLEYLESQDDRISKYYKLHPELKDLLSVSVSTANRYPNK